MDTTQTASLTSLLTALGLGKEAAGIISLLTLVMAVLPQIMPYLPVASASSGKAYTMIYGLLARVVGSRANNAPMPAAGAAPAGGIVPTPPALKVSP